MVEVPAHLKPFATENPDPATAANHMDFTNKPTEGSVSFQTEAPVVNTKRGVDAYGAPEPKFRMPKGI